MSAAKKAFWANATPEQRQRLSRLNKRGHKLTFLESQTRTQFGEDRGGIIARKAG
jgi:hypothetical protein